MPRPRNPDAPGVAERARLSIARLKASGGARRTYRWSAETVAAIAQLRREGETETAALERVIRETLARAHERHPAPRRERDGDGRG